MAALSMFDKEPGTGLPDDVEHIGRRLLHYVEPQLFFTRDHFFTGDTNSWPKESFPGFLKFPVVAGYILGVLGASLRVSKIRLSPENILRSVIDVGILFASNHLDVQLSLHYMMQQSIFKFGLDIGEADVSRFVIEKARTGTSQYVLLAAFCEVFLRYDDAKTLKLNLGISCKMHNLPQRNDSALFDLVERWNAQKYTLEVYALNQAR